MCAGGNISAAVQACRYAGPFLNAPASCSGATTATKQYRHRFGLLPGHLTVQRRDRRANLVPRLLAVGRNNAGADQFQRHRLPRVHTKIAQRPLVVGGLDVVMAIAVSMAEEVFENRKLLFGPPVNLEIEPIPDEDEFVLERIERREPAKGDQ